MFHQYENHKKLNKDIAFMIKNLHRETNGPTNVLAEDIRTVELINKLPDKFKLVYEQTSPILERIYDIQRELMGLKQPAGEDLANEMVDKYNQFIEITQELTKGINEQLAREKVAPDELLSLNGMLNGAAVSIENQLERLNHSIRDSLTNFGMEINTITNNKLIVTEPAASTSQPQSPKPNRPKPF